MAKSTVCQCGAPRRSETQKDCLAYHAKRMREFRARTSLTPLQRKKMNCHSYAHVYLRRGKLVREPCRCGDPNSQMHHPDYDKPLQVEWLCRKCHLELHGSQPFVPQKYRRKEPVAAKT